MINLLEKPEPKQFFSLNIPLLYLWLAILLFPLYGNTAQIHTAVYNGDIQQVQRILLQDPKQIDIKENYFFVIPNDKMAQYGEILRFNFMFREAKSYNSPNFLGYTPLMLAVVMQNFDLVKLLLSFGGSVTMKDPHGLNVIHLASIEGNSKILRFLLLQKNANIFAKDSHGFTPLILACAIGNPEILDILIQEEGRVNDADKNGVTPLMYAALNARLDMAETLLDAGARINAQDRLGNTALMYAAFGGNAGIMAYFLQHGANVNVINKLGISPLIYAVISGQIKIVQFLLEHEANPRQTLGTTLNISRTDTQYPKGSTPLRIAQINRDRAMVEYLTSEF